ncbi:MAG: hypothetical protein PHI98_14860 [Eubacteriales bacterium]|nr:hypothetical protein [Eubacteriales bacterium]
MIYIENTQVPIFCKRKDRKRIKASSELVCEDVTGAVACLIAAAVAVIVLAVLAGPWVPGWMMALGIV